MGIPDYQTLMLPLLQFAADGREHPLRQAIDSLGAEFALTEAELKEMLPSGQSATFGNRVGWARTYLKKAGLLKSTRRGYICATSRGLDVLKNPPERIDNDFLQRFPEFVEFRRPKNNAPVNTKPTGSPAATPEEKIETANSELRDGLVAEILQSIGECSPTFFERLVIDLLVSMGYGGSRKEAGQAVGGSGDGGIDGIIKEDRLGLDIIYIQAKRWSAVVGRPEIQKFAGALQGQRARKGIFITTSGFSKEAISYASSIDNKLILIGGEELANFMIDHDVGVSKISTYEIKRLDSDYFSEA